MSSAFITVTCIKHKYEMLRLWNRLATKKIFNWDISHGHPNKMKSFFPVTVYFVIFRRLWVICLSCTEKNGPLIFLRYKPNLQT